MIGDKGLTIEGIQTMSPAFQVQIGPCIWILLMQMYESIGQSESQIGRINYLEDQIKWE